MRLRLFFLAEILGLLVWALGAYAQDAASQSQGGPAGEVSQGPSQAELDRADVRAGTLAHL